MKSRPTGNDSLNAGHAYLVSGNIQHAVALYRQSRKILGTEAFEAEFEKDRSILIGRGIQEQDIPLILDLI